MKHIMPSIPESDPTEAFIRALSESQSALRGYCFASLGQSDEAKEAFQRANIALWRKCRDWNSETSFLPWAITVAKFEVLGVLRDRHRRESRFIFDPDVVELMIDESAHTAKHSSLRSEALELCLAKLSDSNRKVLSDYYVDGHSITDLSKTYRKAASALKVMLLRLRGKLRECIERTLEKGGAA